MLTEYEKTYLKIKNKKKLFYNNVFLPYPKIQTFPTFHEFIESIDSILNKVYYFQEILDYALITVSQFIEYTVQEYMTYRFALKKNEFLVDSEITLIEGLYMI